MYRINEVVRTLLKIHKPADIAKTLEVTEALISTWKNKENDFVPRLPIATKIYKHYGLITFPYAERALDGSYES